MNAIPLSDNRSRDGWIFTSGQVGRDDKGAPHPDFATQARLAIESLRRSLQARGADLQSVVKTTVFLVRQADFATMNGIYAEYFADPWPARSTVVTGLVAPGFLFEIEAIAYVAGVTDT